MTPLADTGRVIAGRYRLEAPIGRGAMGIVWRARDQLLDRDVAVKEIQLADTLTADERANAYQRTLREAKTAARLSHPGVVSVYDVADDDGRPWIVMELVNARSLDQVLAAEGPLSPRQTAEIGRQLLSALSVAHNAGVLHRDVKPSNVLLGQDGRAVLTDFGIATFQGDPKLTQTGMVMGSPEFTAPERIRGGEATPASDLWSLGATLYAAVQGHGPYESRGGAITTMSAIINEDAPAAAAAGLLSRVIESLLRREPANRPDAAAASRMISDVMPQLPGRPGADGYEPTSLSVAAPGGSYVGDAVLAAQTSMDVTSQEPVAVQEATEPSTWGTPAPPTMPQPNLDDAPRLIPAGGVSRPGTQAPDFSSWYSSPRPSSSGPSGPSRPSRPGSDGTGRRWLLVLLALAIIGAGAGAATVMLLRHSGTDSNTGASSTTSPRVVPSSPNPSTDTLGIPLAINRPSSGPFPAGFTAYTLSPGPAGTTAGFSLSHPGPWQVKRAGYQTYFQDPGLNAYVLVDLTPHTYPADMAREAKYIRRRSAAAHPGYRQLGAITRLSIRGAAGSSWRFTYTDAGVPQEALDLLWVGSTSAGNQSYAMYFTAPAASWSKLRPLFSAIARSFEPVTG